MDEINIEEIEDFELSKTPVSYEVWAVGFNDDYGVADFEVMLDDGYTDLAEAKKCFDYLVDNPELVMKKLGVIPSNVTHVQIGIEQCVGTDCVDVIEEAEIF